MNSFNFDVIINEINTNRFIAEIIFTARIAMSLDKEHLDDLL